LWSIFTLLWSLHWRELRSRLPDSPDSQSGISYVTKVRKTLCLRCIHIRMHSNASSVNSVHFFISAILQAFCFKYIYTYIFFHINGTCLKGMSSSTIYRPSSITQDEMLELIDKFNREKSISGLLVQLPLPGIM